MDVWLLRHAEAEQSGTDENRELTPEGERRSGEVAKGIASLAPGIQVVLVSPYRRARQTAESAARVLGVRDVRVCSALEPGRGTAGVLEELTRGGWKAVLLVGHHPLLGCLLGRLLFDDERIAIQLRKAAAARVWWKPGEAGTLTAFLTPELLERLANGESIAETGRLGPTAES